MEKEMKIKPLLDKVVLKEVEVLESTAAGILLPGSAKEKPQISEVVAVGPGGLVNGERVEMTVSVGDKVITAKYSGAEVKIDGVEYTIVSVNDILAIVEQ
jgi:chaperonin GroES